MEKKICARHTIKVPHQYTYLKKKVHNREQVANGVESKQENEVSTRMEPKPYT